MKKNILFTLLLTLIIMSCNSPSQSKSEDSKKAASETPNIKDEVKTNAAKSQVNTITETKWILVKLQGQAVEMAENQEKQLSFTLQSDQNRLSGFSGCNSFFGTYTLNPGLRIKFDQLGSTKMACPDRMVDEQDFLNVFGLADNYTIIGNSLSLNVGRRAPLAVFMALP